MQLHNIHLSQKDEASRHNNILNKESIPSSWFLIKESIQLPWLLNKHEINLERKKYTKEIKTLNKGSIVVCRFLS